MKVPDGPSVLSDASTVDANSLTTHSCCTTRSCVFEVIVKKSTSSQIAYANEYEYNEPDSSHNALNKQSFLSHAYSLVLPIPQVLHTGTKSRIPKKSA